MNSTEYRCGVEVTLAAVGGKWKGVILWHLRVKTLRFSQLQRRLQSVTQKMLTQQLRELERDGLIHRKIYAEVPPRVEYFLSEEGRRIVPILELMRQWGEEYLHKSARRTLNCSEMPDDQQPSGTADDKKRAPESSQTCHVDRRCYAVCDTNLRR